MTNISLAYALLGAMAIALLFSVYTDLRHRLIYNKVTLPLALAAPVFWYATGTADWSGIASHLITAVIAFAVLCLFFKLRMMGGGDVKLFTVLALWFPWQDFMQAALVTSIAGGIITLIFVMMHKINKNKGVMKIPYGVAIAIGGLFVAGEPLFNHFG